MSTLDRLDELVDRSWRGAPLERWRRWRWFLPGAFAGLVVYAAYLVTHPYPAFGAGLYLSMAERVVETAPAYPRRVPHYTAGGVPMAYPPLMFYVAGTLIEAAGVDGVAVARHLPHVASIVALVPFYLFAGELLEDRRAAGVATLLVATAPPLLQWQISAGGFVRAPAYLFTVVGLYAGLKLFRSGRTRWLLLALTSFTLTVLSHPVYTVFFAFSYLYMFASFDRSVAGLVRGAVVAVGGGVLSAPWWVQTIDHHGPGVLTGAAGTHGGIGRQIPNLVVLFTGGESSQVRAVLFSIHPELFDFSTAGMGVITVWSITIAVALLWYASLDGWRSFLPGWFLVTLLLVSKPRFSFFIGALLIAAVAERTVFRAGRVRSGLAGGRPVLVAGVVALLVVATTGVGALYGASSLDSHAGSTSQPQFVTDGDVAAMEWTAGNTDPDATFVVLGDAAEWFPYFANRTLLIGPWGVEWQGRAHYEAQLRKFNHVSTCANASCLTDNLRSAGVRPDYVYVPKDEYTVRGVQVDPPAELHATLLAADRYELVFENEDVMVFAYTPEVRVVEPRLRTPEALPERSSRTPHLTRDPSPRTVRR